MTVHKKNAVKKNAVKKTANKPVLKPMPVKKIPAPVVLDFERSLIVAFFLDGQPYNQVIIAPDKMNAKQLLLHIQTECFNSFDEQDIKEINEKLTDTSPRVSPDDVTVISIYELI